MKMILLDLDQEMGKFVHFFDEIPESSFLHGQRCHQKKTGQILPNEAPPQMVVIESGNPQNPRKIQV